VTEEGEVLKTSKRREEALVVLEKVYAETRRINGDLRRALNELREAEEAGEERTIRKLDVEQAEAVETLREDEHE
jgi:hypothetical protein